MGDTADRDLRPPFISINTGQRMFNSFSNSTSQQIDILTYILTLSKRQQCSPCKNRTQNVLKQ